MGKDLFRNEENNVWKYRPGNLNDNGTEGLDLNWEKDLSQGVINQKQERLGDISKYKCEDELHTKRPDGKGRVHNAWTFCNVMQKGDIVVACRGADEVIGIGVITGDYYYCENDATRFHKRDVSWVSTREMKISHGLQQGSLARFDLSKEKNRFTVEAILQYYNNELASQKQDYQNDTCVFPESDGIDDDCYEGAIERVLVNKYERNAEARRKCIQHHGAVCKICGFDFEKFYGKLGVGFIHVHHVVPISEIKKEYKIDYVKDLIPVCPNCHAMLHHGAKGKVLRPEELQRIINAK